MVEVYVELFNAGVVATLPARVLQDEVEAYRIEALIGIFRIEG